MKKMIALLVAALMVFGLLTGCGAQTEAYNGGGTREDAMVEQDLAAPGEMFYGATSDSSTTSGNTQVTSQKLVKTVELRAETEDLDAVLTDLAAQIAALGGYTEYQNIYNGSAYASYRARSASLTIRIPADKLEGFLTEVAGFSNVISKTERVDDVTLQYVDTASRMEALQAEHDRLVELMEKAETMADLLTIEERLTQVRYELESVTSQLRVMDNLVDYATIELQIDEVEVLTEVEEPTVFERISTGFMKNLKNLGDSLVDLFVWIITYSPQLLIFAGIVLLIVWLCRRSVRRRKARNTPPPEESA